MGAQPSNMENPLFQVRLTSFGVVSVLTESSTRLELLERATRIELAFSAWEADVLPLNYARGEVNSNAERVSRMGELSWPDRVNNGAKGWNADLHLRESSMVPSVRDHPSSAG
jgi:hypothetical protein